MTLSDALAVATRGGAQVPGRPGIGHQAPGMCADLALCDLRTPTLVGGAVHGPVRALVICTSPQAADTLVNWKVVVRQRRLTTIEIKPSVERRNQLAKQLAQTLV